MGRIWQRHAMRKYDKVLVAQPQTLNLWSCTVEFLLLFEHCCACYLLCCIGKHIARDFMFRSCFIQAVWIFYILLILCFYYICSYENIIYNKLYFQFLYEKHFCDVAILGKYDNNNIQHTSPA